MSKPSTESTRLLRRCVSVLLVAGLAGCASAPEKKPAEEQKTRVSEATRSAYAQALELLRDEQYEQAIAAMKAVAKRNDRLAGPYVNIGIAERALGEPDKAREALEAAIERDDANAAAYNQLGLLHRKAGRFDEARAAYEAGIEADPDYANLYRNLGILCDIYLQDPQCALNNFRAYKERTEGNDEKITRWIADVERRAQ